MFVILGNINALAIIYNLGVVRFFGALRFLIILILFDNLLLDLFLGLFRLLLFLINLKAVAFILLD